MDLYLTTINHNEIFKGNGTIILSSLGRIYVLPNYMNNIYFEHNYSEFLLNIVPVNMKCKKMIKENVNF